MADSSVRRFQTPRGTRDLLPQDYAVHARILTHAREQARLAGFGFIEPPTFENAELFARGVGEGTDIVEKEMYIFEDRGGERLALRPEGTASVCRAYLEHGMANLSQPVKLAYHLPIFRYERPQAGRFRQHTQFGVEAIGVRDPALDAEVIDLGWRLAQSLGLRDLKILLNSIGDTEDRGSYVPKLKAHFEPHLDRIAPDDRARWERAPMRLLDSKDERTRPYQQGAPIITDHLRPESAAYYDAVKSHLEALEIPYEERPTLVRGLDYYTHTVFEIVPTDAEGSQVTVLAGGRYDGLIEQIGGPPTPGIGFGMGIERMAQQLREQGLISDDQSAVDVLIAALGEGAEFAASRIAGELRRRGVAATLAFGGRSLKAQLRQANRIGARFAVIAGARDLADRRITIRNLESSEQWSVGLDEVGGALAELTYTQPQD
ncbi:MAG: histidine--tRNA ligase [Chloroflexi bacterium]|nr:histidine--tRNA ligase [Chloroflexota bacterium]MCY3695878.1 histidine--tRNA ligase [Chloroflexota bacterium]MXX80888.1 histidine--tRNA ligase [Chloroflexota bacterium]MYF22129.1 histidine--tRNA ligase [Chloroflexota bacterium]